MKGQGAAVSDFGIQVAVGMDTSGEIEIGTAEERADRYPQKTPNWNTGISATWAVRIMLTSWPPAWAAVASMVTGMIWAHKPWFGPA